MTSVMEQRTIAFKQELSGYSNKLLSRLCVQWKNVSFCDMFIVTGNKHLPVHACIMSAFSSRVSAHISKSLSTFLGRNLSQPYIMEVEFSYEAIEAIVRALYTGMFCPPASVLAEVSAAVEWLDISELSELLKKNLGGSLSGHVSEDGNVNPAVNTDTQIKAENFSDSLEDYGKSVAVPDYIISWDTPIKDLSAVSNDDSVESNKLPIEQTRRKATKPKSMPRRYNQEQFLLHQHEKVWPSGKSCGGASHHNNEDDLHTVQNEFDMNQVSFFKDLQSFAPLDYSGQTLVSDSREVKNRWNSTTKATDAGSTTQGVLEKYPVSSRKPKRKKSVAPLEMKFFKKDQSATPQDQKITKKAQVSDTDPVNAEIDLLIDGYDMKKCEKCAVKFSSLEMYIAHITNHPVFTCQDCGEVFYRKFDHTKHQRDKHLGRPYLNCRLCEHQAKTEVECRSHYEEVHGEKRPFACLKEGCSFRSQRYVDLHLHTKIHSGEKEFCCEKCGQRFTQYISLKSHHKSCYRMSSFLCDLCGQSFNHQQSMKIHRRTVHLQEKPFSCKDCSKQFSNHSNLKRHMRIHNNSFPYSCPVCMQLFRHSNTLRGHMSSKHKEADSTIKPDPSNKLGGMLTGFYF